MGGHIGRHAATATAGSTNGAAEPGRPWQGSFTPYSVGDPGRAAGAVVSAPDRDCWDRPDTVLDGVTLTAGGERRPVVDLRAASVRGLAHRYYGRVRQDEYGFRVTGDGRTLIVAVADGVSAGRLSHVAATLAVRHGIGLLVEQLRAVPPQGLDWAAVLSGVAEAVEREGRRLIERAGSPAADRLTTRDVAEHLATTALYAIIELDEVDRWFPVHLVVVGDTSAWILGADGAWRPQQPVKNEGEDIYSSAVSALPLYGGTPPAPVRTGFGQDEALVLMSDGIGDPLAGGTGAVGRFLAEAWRRPPADLEFAAQVGFARSTYDDDRTAVAIWPIGKR